MKNKFLGLFILSLTVASADRALGTDLLQHQQPVKFHRSSSELDSLDFKDRSLVKKEQTHQLDDFIEQNIDRDPYDMDEESESLYRDGNFDEAARAFVAAAVLGIMENQNTLYQMDANSLTYIQEKQYSKLEHVCQKLKEDFAQR